MLRVWRGGIKRAAPLATTRPSCPPSPPSPQPAAPLAARTAVAYHLLAPLVPLTFAPKGVGRVWQAGWVPLTSPPALEDEKPIAQGVRFCAYGTLDFPKPPRQKLFVEMSSRISHKTNKQTIKQHAATTSNAHMVSAASWFDRQQPTALGSTCYQ